MLQMAGIFDLLDAEQAGCLKVDTAAPLSADLLEHRPGNVDLLANAVEMRADGAGSMRVCAAEREIHARPHIRRRPVRLPVAAGVLQPAHEGAIRIAPPRPDMALVEMGVHIDKAGRMMPPSRSSAPGWPALGAMADMRPSAMLMSTAGETVNITDKSDVRPKANGMRARG